MGSFTNRTTTCKPEVDCYRIYFNHRVLKNEEDIYVKPALMPAGGYKQISSCFLNHSFLTYTKFEDILANK